VALTAPALARAPRPVAAVAPPAVPPPFVLPASFFVIALSWLVVGSVALLAAAPAIAHGNFLAPEVFATVHAFTLGIITTTIFGVFHQFLPMALGVSARSVRAGLWALGALTAGTLALVVGFWGEHAVLKGAGWILVLAAIGIEAWNLPTRKGRAPGSAHVRAHIAAGHAALGLALAFAGARIGENLGWWTVDRMGIIAAHFHLAALGFATLTAVGVGSRMLPMFLVSHGTPTWPVRLIAPTTLAGLLIFCIGAVAHIPPLTIGGGLVMAAAALLFVHLVRGYFARRLRRAIDPPLTHVAVAVVALAATVGVGLALLLLPGTHPRLRVVYALLAILGWLVFLVLGMLYKIFTHLSWIHVHGRRSGAVAVTVNDLLRPSWTRASLSLLMAGLLTLVLGTALGNARIATVGAVGWLLGALLVPAQYLRMFLPERS
jgi:hypothetical protein